MAYELPLVRVYQQLEEVSPTLASPDLPACIVGRAYQVLTYADDKVETYVESYDKDNGNDFLPPNLLPGALVESSDVKIYMDDMYIEIVTNTFTAVVDTSLVTDVTKDFTALNIDVGDKVYITHASLSTPLERTIIEIAATELKLNKNFTVGLASATYSVQKKLDDRLLVSGNYSIDGNTVTVLPGINHTYESVSYAVKAGELYMEYKALRTDLTANIDDISSTAEIISKVGKIVAANPLALGLKLAKDNTVTSVKFIGVDTKEADNTGWSNAKDRLENTESVYFLALLTDSASVIGSFSTHCTQMSTAENHAWRVCSGGVPLVTEREIISSDSGVIYDDGGTFYLRDNDKEFLIEGVSPADRIEITGPVAVTGSYVVDTVINDNVLKPTATIPFPQAASGVEYTIERDMSKSQQAQYIADTIDAYDNKRVIIPWPDECEVNGETVSGYFLGAVVAGMVAGLPPHQGLTNMGIAGVDELFHSNTYFNKEQLNTIAGAGAMIFVQETPTSLPYIRHQQTTDTQYVETRELSVVKNFDHLSYYFFELLKPFIGPYNITDRTVGQVNEVIILGAEAKRKAELPKIGAPLKDYTLVSGEESSTSSDKTEHKLRMDLPKPLNGIDLYLAI